MFSILCRHCFEWQQVDWNDGLVWRGIQCNYECVQSCRRIQNVSLLTQETDMRRVATDFDCYHVCDRVRGCLLTHERIMRCVNDWWIHRNDRRSIRFVWVRRLKIHGLSEASGSGRPLGNWTSAVLGGCRLVNILRLNVPDWIEILFNFGRKFMTDKNIAHVSRWTAQWVTSLNCWTLEFSPTSIRF